MGSCARCELSAGLTLGPFALVARERLALQVHVKPEPMGIQCISWADHSVHRLKGLLIFRVVGYTIVLVWLQFWDRGKNHP